MPLPCGTGRPLLPNNDGRSRVMFAAYWSTVLCSTARRLRPIVRCCRIAWPTAAFRAGPAMTPDARVCQHSAAARARGANRLFEAGFYDSATSSESTQSVTRELLDAAILFDSNRSLHAVRQPLYSSHDCCISVVVLGGSTTCPHVAPHVHVHAHVAKAKLGAMKKRTDAEAPKGLEQA